jgi:putative intracellular protease/amidase
MEQRDVHVAVYDGLADWEIGHVTAHVAQPDWQREPGRFRIVTVASSPEPVRSLGGLRIVPDLTIDEVDPSTSALWLLPGAPAWLDGGNEPFARRAAEFLDVGVPVAAICGATAGLARLGLLDGRWHTSNAAVFLASTGYAGADRYRDEPAVTDDNVVTASATAPVEFAREIFRLLDVYDPSVLESWYKLYGQNDPAGFYELAASVSA